MARLRESSSFESMLAYLAQVIAGLGALDELAHLVPPLLALRERLKAARDARDEARWTLLGKSARVRVFDQRWDSAVKAVSGHAFLASNKDASQPPYSLLFSGVTADDAADLGPSKAEAFGGLLLSKGAALNDAALNPLLAKVQEAQALLVSADKERDAAFGAASVHEVERFRLLNALEAAADAAEVGILTAFPGQRKLVNAILVQDRDSSGGGGESGGGGSGGGGNVG